jgi:hypothetical protein
MHHFEIVRHFTNSYQSSDMTKEDKVISEKNPLQEIINVPQRAEQPHTAAKTLFFVPLDYYENDGLAPVLSEMLAFCRLL